MSETAEEAAVELGVLLKRTEYLKAYDLAAKAIATHPDHVALRHAGVLALARMGAADRARQQFMHWGLDEITDDEDVIALWGRLLKDDALASDPQNQAAKLLEAAKVYARAYDASGGYFSAINVASLNLLAGEHEEAHEWARKATALAEQETSFYASATIAEAALILGHMEKVEAALALTMENSNENFAAMSTTRRQLGLIADSAGLPRGFLDVLKPPAVSHFCGHRVSPDGKSGRFPKSKIPRVRAEIARTIAENDIRFAFGSLAAGADILFAEEIISAGGELTVVLPFDQEDFLDVSVRDCGAEWVERFHSCLAAASEIHFVTEDAYLGHDELFNYASNMAMGLASLRAQSLGSEVHQIAVWDGEPSRAEDAAGTAVDIAAGVKVGLKQHLIPSREDVSIAKRPSLTSLPNDPSGRQRMTMVFGDLKGFSKLGDEQLPVFVEHVLGVCASVMRRHQKHLCFRNTWGDGLFVVFNSLRAAAECAFDLRSAVANLDHSNIGLPDTLGLRLGMHYGPVFESHDPVLERTNYFGYHVSRAARVEPITPEGEVYVTEHTAAALALEAPDEFRCDYVGRVPLAKGYGEFPMYALKRSCRTNANRSPK